MSDFPPELRSPGPTRRQFLRTLVAMAGAGVLAIAGVLAVARGRRSRPARVSLPEPTADGVALHPEVVLVRVAGELRAFSARCPHLGCRLAGVEGDELVCPCHGSRFGLDGKRRRGPAVADLSALAIEPSREAGTIDVVLPR